LAPAASGYRSHHPIKNYQSLIWNQEISVIHHHMDVVRPGAKPLLLSYVKEQNSAQKEIS
jgi:hypothetical protein